MHNQFCKNCGQANFPNASVCSKCGASLGNQPGQNQGSQFQETPPTMQTPDNQKTEKKGSNKFLIIGGIAAVLVLFLGFIAIVAGIGGYYYFSSSEDEVVNVNTQTPPKEDKPANENTIDENKPSAMSDTKLEDYMKNDRRTVGSYTLDNVKAFKGNDFSGRVAGVTALYTNGSKKVVHSIAMFNSYNEASDDFDKYKRGIRSMQGSQVRSSEQDRIIFSHKGSMFLTFCNKAGGCHELISKDGNTILDYYDSYFGKS